MTMTTGSAISRAPRPSSLADVLDLILDKGLVIDAYVRVSAVGIELLTIDARIVIASVDTYLHYAEAVNRLDLTQTETKGLTGMFGDDDSSGDQSQQGNGSRSSENGKRRSLQGRSREDESSGGRGAGDRQLGRARSQEEGDGGDEEESDGGDDEESGGEGRARTLARRIGEKGRWNS